MSREPLWAEGEGWTLEPTPDFRIGGIEDLDGSGPLFSAVRDIAVAPDGVILISDAFLGSVSVFDRTGSYLRTLGKRGEGPGEFSWGPGSVFPCTDGTVIVLGGGGLSRFDTGGEYLSRSLTRIGTATFGVVGATRDCTRFLVHQRGPGPAEGEQGLSYRTISWADPSFTRLDTIGIVPVAEMFRGGGEIAPNGMVVPWSSGHFNFGVAGEDAVAGWGGHPEVKVYSEGPAPRKIIRWNAPARPVTRADRNEYENQRRRYIAGFGNNEETRLIFPPLGDFRSLPEVKPYFDGLMTDAEGRIWLRHWPEDYVGLASTLPSAPGQDDGGWWDYTWTVLDADGRWLGELEMPSRFQLMDATDDRVYGVELDSLDVPTVAAYRIVKPGG
ncbi:MAG: hypothetical protein RQ745_08385 [Longimicrobiales bacterium]|nr:hypothetical protein [Longimicrobiales bacterium]